MKATLQPVEVRWLDTASTHGWHRLDELKDDDGMVEIRTVGYLTRSDAKCVQVSQSRHIDDARYHMRVGEVLTIPRRCVRKITPVRGLA